MTDKNQNEVEITMLLLFADAARYTKGYLTLSKIRRGVKEAFHESNNESEFGIAQVNIAISHMQKIGFIEQKIDLFFRKIYRIKRSGMMFVEDNFQIEKSSKNDRGEVFVTYDTSANVKEVSKKIEKYIIEDINNSLNISNNNSNMNFLHIENNYNWTKWGTIIAAISLLITFIFTIWSQYAQTH